MTTNLILFFILKEAKRIFARHCENVVGFVSDTINIIFNGVNVRISDSQKKYKTSF